MWMKPVGERVMGWIGDELDEGESCTHTQMCALSFITSLVPQKVILHLLYNPGSVNQVS